MEDSTAQNSSSVQTSPEERNEHARSRPNSCPISSTAAPGPSVPPPPPYNTTPMAPVPPPPFYGSQPGTVPLLPPFPNGFPPHFVGYGYGLSMYGESPLLNCFATIIHTAQRMLSELQQYQQLGLYPPPTPYSSILNQASMYRQNEVTELKTTTSTTSVKTQVTRQPDSLAPMDNPPYRGPYADEYGRPYFNDNNMERQMVDNARRYYAGEPLLPPPPLGYAAMPSQPSYDLGHSSNQPPANFNQGQPRNNSTTGEHSAQQQIYERESSTRLVNADTTRSPLFGINKTEVPSTSSGSSASSRSENNMQNVVIKESKSKEKELAEAINSSFDSQDNDSRESESTTDSERELMMRRMMGMEQHNETIEIDVVGGMNDTIEDIDNANVNPNFKREAPDSEKDEAPELERVECVPDHQEFVPNCTKRKANNFLLRTKIETAEFQQNDNAMASKKLKIAVPIQVQKSIVLKISKMEGEKGEWGTRNLSSTDTCTPPSPVMMKERKTEKRKRQVTTRSGRQVKAADKMYSSDSSEVENSGRKRPQPKVSKPKVPKGEFPCTFCSKIFPYFSQFRNHQKGHETRICIICHLEFRDKTQLAQHLCSGGIEEESNVKVKKARKARAKAHECGICHQTFASSQEVKVHRADHDAVGKYACVNCSRRFHFWQTRKSHMTLCNIKVDLVSEAEEEEETMSGDDIVDEQQSSGNSIASPVTVKVYCPQMARDPATKVLQVAKKSAPATVTCSSCLAMPWETCSCDKIKDISKL